MRLRSVIISVLGSILVVGLTAQAAGAADPVFLNWTDVAPAMTSGYDPNSSNVCTAGKIQCVDAVIKEMTKRFNGLLKTCDHNAMFSLAYLRTTEEYRRAVLEPGFFADPAFLNHYDAVFASYYFDARDSWARGDVAGTPSAWRIAFQAAAQRTATGVGDALLGMSAHINRDLPYVLWQIGLNAPDGTSRKADHDKVNEFLNRVAFSPEAQRRLDPDFDLSTDVPGGMQLIIGWREQAWRNAERLRSAENDPTQLAAVKQSIEDAAAAEALALLASNSYAPPVSSTTARDSYCMVHRYDV